MKKIILLLVMFLTIIIWGCGKGSENTVRYLNFKPEIANVYKEIANEYEKETGIKVEVETAASGSYESTLQARMSTSMAPTIFQINGPIGYLGWKEYCLDLKNTKLYSELLDKDLAITEGDGVYGIPFVVEGYGIIYNDAIMKKYFESAWKNVSLNSVSEINSFEELESVVTDMQANRDKLGINGVFASTSLKTGEDWRWQTHLLNINLHHALNNKEDKSLDIYKDIEFSTFNNFKKIFDLYINNSVRSKSNLGTVTVSDSMAEFALGKCAMVQNGNWGSSQVLGVSGNTVKSEDIKFMPIYMDLDGEENQGLCIGTENFLCINKKATEEEQKNAIDFLEWLYLSDKGKEYVRDKLKFISPFESSDSSKMTDPLALEVVKWLENKSVNNIPWSFTIIPSTTFKNEFGANLLKYSQDKMTWSDLEKAFNSKWKSEWDLLIK